MQNLIDKYCWLYNIRIENVPFVYFSNKTVVAVTMIQRCQKLIVYNLQLTTTNVF